MFRIGDEVKVRVARVNMEDYTIDFELVDMKQQQRRERTGGSKPGVGFARGGEGRGKGKPHEGRDRKGGKDKAGRERKGGRDAAGKPKEAGTVVGGRGISTTGRTGRSGGNGAGAGSASSFGFGSGKGATTRQQRVRVNVRKRRQPAVFLSVEQLPQEVMPARAVTALYVVSERARAVVVAVIAPLDLCGKRRSKWR